LRKSIGLGHLRTSAPNLQAELYDNPHDYLTYDELAKLLRVSVRTLRRWVSFEKVPYVKIEEWHVRFPKSDIAAWLHTRGA